MHKCNQCTECFSRKDYLIKHKREKHEGQIVKHYFCSHSVQQNNDDFPKTEKNGFTRILSSHAFNGLIKNIRFFQTSTKNIINPFEFMKSISDFVTETVGLLIDVKISTKHCVLFIKLNDNESTTHEAYFSSKCSHIKKFDYDKITNDILNKIEQYETRGSNWKILRTLFLELYVIKTH